MEHKEEILKTRKGGLGSSDAQMIERIAIRGGLCEGDRQRVAELLGLAERKQFSTGATRLGDEIEMGIYEIIKTKYPQTKSNPYYKSEKLSEEYGFSISNHIDYEVETEKELIWIENKATKYPLETTLSIYKSQLNWHYMLLKEKAKSKRKKARLFLSHYQTEKTPCFNANNLNLTEFLNGNDKLIKKGLSVLKTEINGFVYSPKDELFVQYLPDSVKEEFSIMGDYFKQIKDMNEKLESFKERMVGLMMNANVKSIKSDDFTLTLIGETKTTTFDKKKFGADYPDLLGKYTTTTNKKAYVKITT